MKRRIIMFAPGGTDASTRVDELLEQLRGLGCEIIADENVDDASHADTIRLIDLVTYSFDKDRAHKCGLVTVAKVMRLTAYEAWRVLAGQELRADGKTRRGVGHLFTSVCKVMARNGWRFADLDPADMTQYSADDWKQQGIGGRLASLLDGVEVRDVRILTQLTDEDIAGFFLNPGKRYDELIAVRDEMRGAAQ